MWRWHGNRWITVLVDWSIEQQELRILWLKMQMQILQDRDCTQPRISNLWYLCHTSLKGRRSRSWVTRQMLLVATAMEVPWMPRTDDKCLEGTRMACIWFEGTTILAVSYSKRNTRGEDQKKNESRWNSRGYKSNRKSESVEKALSARLDRRDR